MVNDLFLIYLFELSVLFDQKLAEFLRSESANSE